MILDYETLKVIWWLFVGVLLVGFALTDGWDLGVGTLLPFLGRTDEERRVIINSIGATWEGNQVWFITAGGATFAAWPLVYATAFSGFYAALILTLFALFFRPVGIDFRSKVEDPRWRSAWDWGLFIGGTVPAVVFGVAFGNLLLGVPFHFEPTLQVYYTGSFFALLNPFGLLCGLLSLAMLVMHGAAYLHVRTEGEIYARARAALKAAATAVIVLFAVGGIWVATGIEGYRIVSMPPADSAFMPLAKAVEKSGGAWLGNYSAHPWMIAAPLLGFGGAALAILFSARNRQLAAFVGSALSVAGIVLTAGFSLFPFIMPSSSSPQSSLTVWDAVSSHRTLHIMFWVVVLMLPVVIAYTAWVYRVMRGKVTVEQIRQHPHSMY
ncbi:MAG TPA: cytochrome d ubiquinol oxidase subunit II [Burkholderiales bacterium]|nr:cytochrome d ubiquinol oxidase subunit II [Burkholderiales bacterium]